MVRPFKPMEFYEIREKVTVSICQHARKTRDAKVISKTINSIAHWPTDCIQKKCSNPTTVKAFHNLTIAFKEDGRVKIDKMISFCFKFPSHVPFSLVKASETVAHRFGNPAQSRLSAENHFNLPSPGSSLSVSNIALSKFKIAKAKIAKAKVQEGK